MNIASWFSPEILPFAMPLVIYLSRIGDVTIGTLRIVFITRGKRLTATVLGFFEVLIWSLVVSQVITNMDNIFNFFAYAAGYASGNYIGIYVENKLAIGNLLIRIITRKPAKALIHYFHQKQYRYTNVPAQGDQGEVNVLFTVIKRKNLPEILEQVKKQNPHAIYSIEDVRDVSQSLFPKDHIEIDYLRWFRPMMKGK